MIGAESQSRGNPCMLCSRLDCLMKSTLLGSKVSTAGPFACCAPGWSFVFDPIYGDPAEPRWVQFYTQLLPLARSLGARVGGSQTKALGTLPRALPLPRGFARERFLTPYFRQFLVDDAAAPAFAPAGPWQKGAIN